MHPQLEIGTRQDRAQERLGGAPPDPPFLIDVELATTFIIAAVKIIYFCDAAFGSRLTKGIKDFPAHAAGFESPLAADPTPVIGAKKEIFRFFEIWQHILA